MIYNASNEIVNDVVDLWKDIGSYNIYLLDNIYKYHHHHQRLTSISDSISPISANLQVWRFQLILHTSLLTSGGSCSRVYSRCITTLSLTLAFRLSINVAKFYGGCPSYPNILSARLVEHMEVHGESIVKPDITGPDVWWKLFEPVKRIG